MIKSTSLADTPATRNAAAAALVAIVAVVSRGLVAIWRSRMPVRVTIQSSVVSMMPSRSRLVSTCLLYTSDAADERSSVDLGGRRTIQKKKQNNTKKKKNNNTKTKRKR